jgi:CheY-like chemotaxis protein
MNERVLVVDDQPLIREVMRMMIESRGFIAVSARDGEEASKLLVSMAPAIALVDVDMPGANGLEVCRALRTTAATLGRVLPVWLMTGVERPGLEEQAERAGALGVLAKPFTCDELVLHLRRGLQSLPPASSAA